MDWAPADAAMLADCAALRGAALETSTTDSYRWGIEQVAHWAATEHGMQRNVVLPAKRGQAIAARHVGAFLKWGAGRWNVGTLKVVQGAIAHWHHENGAANFLDTPEGDLWKRGAAKLAARRQGARGVRRAPGLPLAVLRALVAWLRRQEDAQPQYRERYRRDAAWAVLGFYGLLRRSELGALRVRDVTVAQGGVAIYIHKSKNSQLVGVWIHLPDTTASGMHIREIVQRWLATRHELDGGAAPPDGPLFTAWQRGGAAPARGRMTARALAPTAKGQALVEMFKLYLGQMVADGTLQGEDAVQPYTGHSLRRGGATALYHAGWTAEEIIAHGRWTSEAYRIYLERTVEQRRDIVRRL